MSYSSCRNRLVRLEHFFRRCSANADLHTEHNLPTTTGGGLFPTFCSVNVVKFHRGILSGENLHQMVARLRSPF